MQGYSGHTGPLTSLELLAWAVWALALAWEHTADRQKKRSGDTDDDDDDDHDHDNDDDDVTGSSASARPGVSAARCARWGCGAGADILTTSVPSYQPRTVLYCTVLCTALYRRVGGVDQPVPGHRPRPAGPRPPGLG